MSQSLQRLQRRLQKNKRSLKPSLPRSIEQKKRILASGQALFDARLKNKANSRFRTLADATKTVIKFNELNEEMQKIKSQLTRKTISLEEKIVLTKRVSRIATILGRDEVRLAVIAFPKVEKLMKFNYYGIYRGD